MKASRGRRILYSTVIVDQERLIAWNSGILVRKANKVNYKVVFQKVIKRGNSLFRTVSELNPKIRWKVQ